METLRLESNPRAGLRVQSASKATTSSTSNTSRICTDGSQPRTNHSGRKHGSVGCSASLICKFVFRLLVCEWTWPSCVCICFGQQGIVCTKGDTSQMPVYDIQYYTNDYVWPFLWRHMTIMRLDRIPQTEHASK